MSRSLIAILLLHTAIMVAVIVLTRPQFLFALTAAFSFLHQLGRETR